MMNAANKTRTAAQQNRQSARSRKNGTYAKFNPCELCGKSAGYDYCSIQWLDEAPFHGRGICLHEKCCSKLEAAGKEKAFAMLEAAAAK